MSSDGVAFDPVELDEALVQLTDCGLVMHVQKQPPSPLFLVLKSRQPYDQAAALAADVCASVKRRGERFESDQELCSWLDQDGVDYTAESLSAGLHHLERQGRFRRPRQDQWGEWPLPGIYAEPRIHVEIF